MNRDVSGDQHFGFRLIDIAALRFGQWMVLAPIVGIVLLFAGIIVYFGASQIYWRVFGPRCTVVVSHAEIDVGGGVYVELNYTIQDGNDIDVVDERESEQDFFNSEPVKPVTPGPLIAGGPPHGEGRRSFRSQETVPGSVKMYIQPHEVLNFWENQLIPICEYQQYLNFDKTHTSTTRHYLVVRSK